MTCVLKQRASIAKHIRCALNYSMGFSFVINAWVKLLASSVLPNFLNIILIWFYYETEYIRLIFSSLSSSFKISSSASKSFLEFIRSRSILGFTLYNRSEISLDISPAFFVVNEFIIILTIYIISV